ncbi:glutathione S-transferase family protein [Sphingobium boeckii]|uniref:Glutathione S-transferase n=1 Tax=Sphingobium boeckii TaxID=1082345 RepID=A0A7W9EEK2_9SPHN|nr:glutathione S-transferase family protein [Sphingobium boeckii]MBB5686267.1 glutathione S-transferase [Sphingobium boeckii]
MTIRLYAHPFSSYCQKALIALYENGTPFDYRTLEDAENDAALEKLWPLKKFPLLEEDGRVVIEATGIIEYLAVHHGGPVALIPADPAAAVDVRIWDRFFDNYVMNPQQQIVFNLIRPENDRDPLNDTQARATLNKAYAWLDGHMAGRIWAAGADFSMADCAAAPALFYADWSHPIPAAFAHVHAYRRRLLARPSFARCVDEARHFRAYFPGGAPDRD